MNAISPIEAEKVRPDAGQSSRRRWRRYVIAPGAVVLGALAWLLLRHEPAASTPAPPVVTVATPLLRQVAEWDDYVGRFAPSQSVEVRPRVNGAVVALHFHDGDLVRKGQLLFTIDPRPFKAALAEAQAGVLSAQSALALARSDLDRATRLTGDEALSAAEVDGLKSRLQAASAGLAGAQARAAARALDVEFTSVRAPITGRISDRRVDVGNLVAGGEGAAATLLTTINALDPIYFTFDASEALYLKAQRARRTGQSDPTVEIRLQDEPDYHWRGAVDFTDNGLNDRSGTIRGRAVLANPDNFLTPGMFGAMRLANAGTVDALLAPDSAVQTDQARKTLLVVAADGSVSARAVTLGPVVAGLRVIRSGLNPQDRIVIAGTQYAMPGGKVTPHTGQITPEAVATTAAVSAPAAAQATFVSR